MYYINRTVGLKMKQSMYMDSICGRPSIVVTFSWAGGHLAIWYGNLNLEIRKWTDRRRIGADIDRVIIYTQAPDPMQEAGGG